MTTPAPIQRNESRSSSLSQRLFRSKSGEALGDRKGSGSRLRKQKENQQQQQAQAPKSPPRLPEYSPQPLGISPRMTSKDYANGQADAPPVPPLPRDAERKESMDPYARTESMTHR
jgi:stalled ribosome alternative rescue factor ArfA